MFIKSVTSTARKRANEVASMNKIPDALDARLSRKATAEALEDRFPLLVECLSGQPEQIRTSLTARFQPVKANLEFALAVAPDAAGRLLEETRNGGFEVTTGEQGALVSVYGAGLVRPDKVDELAGRLIAAAAPGQTVKIAFRDAEGLLHFAEHHSERTAATGA